NLADGLDRAASVVLDGLDLLADVLGRLRGLLGELLDLVGHAGEALTRLSRARRLDRGVERQKVRLLRDGRDYLDDLADLGAALAQVPDRVIGAVGGLDCLRRDAGGLAGVLGDFADAGRHLFDGGGHALHVAAYLLRRSRHHARLGRGLLGVRSKLLTDRGELLGRAGK